jgi:hypothetical protein
LTARVNFCGSAHRSSTPRNPLRTSDSTCAWGTYTPGPHPLLESYNGAMHPDALRKLRLAMNENLRVQRGGADPVAYIDVSSPW